MQSMQPWCKNSIANLYGIFRSQNEFKKREAREKTEYKSKVLPWNILFLLHFQPILGRIYSNVNGMT